MPELWTPLQAKLHAQVLAMDEGHKVGAAATIAERQAAQRGIFSRADADQNGRLGAEELAAYLFPEEAQREEATAHAADDAKAFVQVGGRFVSRNSYCSDRSHGSQLAARVTRNHDIPLTRGGSRRCRRRT